MDVKNDSVSNDLAQKNLDQLMSFFEDQEEEDEDDEILANVTFKVPSSVDRYTEYPKSSSASSSLSLPKHCLIIDIIKENWISTFSGVKNLRLLVGFLSKEILNKKKKKKNNDSNSDISNDIREIFRLRDAIKDILIEWTLDGPVDESCSIETLQRFLVEYRSRKMRASKIDPFAACDINPKVREMFDTSISNEYKKYLTHLYNRVRVMYSCESTGTTRIPEIDVDDCEQQQQQENEEEEEEDNEKGCTSSYKTPKRQKMGEGENAALFDSSIFKQNEKQRIDDNSNRLSQFITKLDSNGKLSTWRTPGESGQSVIRIEIYNFKDIVRKEKRTWWKSARLRTQFISQEACPVKLTEILNEVATEMSKVSGLTAETRNVTI